MDGGGGWLSVRAANNLSPRRRQVFSREVRVIRDGVCGGSSGGCSGGGSGGVMVRGGISHGGNHCRLGFSGSCAGIDEDDD